MANDSAQSVEPGPVRRGRQARPTLGGDTGQMREQPGSRALPTGVVTFLFTDIESSSALWAESQGAMDQARMLHDQLVRSTIHEAGGHVFSQAGDGFAAAFQSPSAAARASLLIHDRCEKHVWPDGALIRIRIGLHLGEAIERDAGYFGPSVNTAARVMSAGHGGQTVASAVFAQVVAGSVHLLARDLGEHELRGIAGGMHLWQLSASGTTRAFPPLRTNRLSGGPHSNQPATALVERDVELALLNAQLSQLISGTGGLVVISGEAGSGKSSLLSAVARRCRTLDIDVAQGACDPLSTARILGAWRDIAAHPVTGMGDMFAAGRDQVDVVEDLLVSLRSFARPLVLFIEDLHWADESTVAVLRMMARRLHSLGVLVVTTIRTEDGAHVTQALADVVSGPGNRSIELSALSKRAVAQLVERTGRANGTIDPAEVHRMTGGNPFFVSEVLASDDAVPESIRASVVHRLRQLSESAQRLVETLAAAPRELDYHDVAALTEATTTDIDHAVGAGLVVLDGLALRFRHDLARMAIYSELSLQRRLDIHSGFVVRLLNGAEPDVDLIAHHAISSLDPQLIVSHVPTAAVNAATHGSLRQAEDYYLAAIEAADRTAPALAAELRTLLSRVLSSLGRDPSEGLMLNARAIDYAEQQGLNDVLGRALSVRAILMVNLPNVAEAHRCMERALSILERRGASPELFEAVLRDAMMTMFDRRVVDATVGIHRAIGLANELGDPKLVLQAERLLIVSRIGGSESELAVRHLIELVENADRMGDTSVFLSYVGMLGSGAGEFKHFDVAENMLGRSIETLERLDRPAAARYDQAWLARVYAETGRWNEAISVGREVMALVGGTHGPSMMTARTAVGRSLVRQGDTEGQRLLSEVAEQTDRYYLQYVWPLLCSLAESHWLAEDVDAMRLVIEPVYERALLTDSTWARGETGFWMWKAGLIDEPPGLCAEPYRLQISGDWRGAAEAWSAIGAPYEEALALADGDVAARSSALEILDGLGAVPVAEMLRAQAQADHGVDRRYEGSGLTRRQFEVLEQIRDGLDNQTIGQQLFVSKKTVEHHVSAIFASLGVSSRTAAVAEANRRQLFSF